MISNYRSLMERMKQIANNEHEVKLVREYIIKIINEIEMLKDVYEGESSISIREIVRTDLENQIKNYAKVGSKILGTQIQYFTRQYLNEDNETARKLFDKYKKDTNTEHINESYPFEIKKASRLFIREIVNAMNIENIEKSYEKLDDFISVSGDFFENKLKTNYIELLKIAGDFFRRYDLLSGYCLEYDKNMKENKILDIQYDPLKNQNNGDKLTVEETFMPEHLEELDIYTVMSLNIFWQNRMAKDSKRIYTAFYVLDKLELLEDENPKNKLEETSDEQIKELMARKLFIARLSTFKVRNYIDGLDKYDKSLEDRIEGYARTYYQEFGGDLEKEINDMQYEQANNENIYIIKDQSLAYLTKMLSEDKSKVPNWGIVPEASDELYALISIDLPGYNMPISLHTPKDILIQSLNSLNTSKNDLSIYTIPVYDGHLDFKINNKYVPTNVLMPLSDKQKSVLTQQANCAKTEDSNYKLLQHLSANAKGQVAPHLKRIEVKNGVKFLNRNRRYYNVVEEKYYKKDEKGKYILELLGEETNYGR